MAVNVFTVELDGEMLGTFDENELTLEDTFVIENNTGLLINEMLSGIAGMKLRAKSVQALVWFMRYKSGKPVDLNTINFKLTGLNLEPVENPTRAVAPRSKGTTAPAETATSDTSPSTAT